MPKSEKQIIVAKEVPRLRVVSLTGRTALSLYFWHARIFRARIFRAWWFTHSGVHFQNKKA